MPSTFNSSPLSPLPALLMMATALAVAFLAAGALAQTPPPSDGDWVIGDHTVMSHASITVRGNVTVLSGGRLDLSSSTLLLDLPASGAYHVEVMGGGTLVLDAVTLDSADGSSLYNLTVLGSAAIVNGSVVRRLDGPTTPNPLATPRGLVVRTSSFRLEGSTVEGCGGFAITVQPSGAGDIGPELIDSVVRNNGGGVYCGGLLSSGDAIIRGCAFYGNTIGDVVAVAADPTITGCVFGGSILTPSTTGVTAIAMAEPTVTDCRFSFLLAAVNSVLASPTVRDCSISLCAAGVSILGGYAVVEGVTVSNTIVPMVLNATNARVTDCVITGFTVPAYAVVIDSGRPLITNLTVDLGLVGGAISIVNGSRPTVRDSRLSGSGAAPVVHAEGSEPVFEGCTVEGGTHGLELVSSPATLRDCLLRGNSGWGIASWFETFSSSGLRFGTGADSNGDGRIIQYHSLAVRVQLEDGNPAADASVRLFDDPGDEVMTVTTDGTGFALSEVLVAYEVTNTNRTISYSPYLLDARLDELVNVTSVDIAGNPDLVLVLRPIPRLPPVVMVTSPEDGATYNAWDHRGGIPLEGTATDPEGGPVVTGWTVDGVDIEGTAGPVFPDPGPHVVGLRAVDRDGLETWVNVSFTVVSVPPASFGITIDQPAEGQRFPPDATVEVRASYLIEEDPYHDVSVPPNITWTSSLDGLLPVEGAEGVLAGLSYGEHGLTVVLAPRSTKWLPEAYSDTVTFWVSPPDPVAVANISSPEDGAVFLEGEAVLLAALGSRVETWVDEGFRTVMRWSSDRDGALGEGMELEARYLSAGIHVIRLEVTTVPFLASDNSTVTITVEVPPHQPPVARITLLTGTPEAGRPVLLSGGGSFSPGGGTLTYHWDLGDGNVSSLVEVDHTYGEAGNYTVVLTVSDGSGVGTAQLVVRVEAGDGGDDGDDGDGNGGGDGPQEPDSYLTGWLLIAFLLLALAGLLALAWRGREGAR